MDAGDTPVANLPFGGKVDYYLCKVKHPQRREQPPYQAECEDLIHALQLTPDEANIFKEIWRGARGRQGTGKPDHKRLYGAQKMKHYAGRLLMHAVNEASDSTLTDREFLEKMQPR